MLPTNSYVTGPQPPTPFLNWPPAVSTSRPLLILVPLPEVLFPSFSHHMGVSSGATSDFPIRRGFLTPLRRPAYFFV